MLNTELLIFLKENWGLYSVAGFALIVFILHLPKFIDSVTYFKSRKIQHINEALESSHVDDESKRLLSENITRIYLSRSLGIKANVNEVRETLKIYDLLQGKFNTLIIYRSIGDLPLKVYNLSLEELRREKLEIEHVLIVNRYIMNIYVLMIFITFPLFLYYSAPAFLDNELFSYKNLNIGFVYGFGFLMALIAYIINISEHKVTQTAIDIVSCFISNAESD